MGKILRVLEFLRVIDRHDGTVSLSSVALGATTTAALANPSWFSLGAMLIAVVAYGHRRHVNGAHAIDRGALEVAARAAAEVGARLDAEQKARVLFEQRMTQELNARPRR